MDTAYDIIIAGSGPAGLTAGIYAARAGKRAAVIGASVGGAAALTHLIENYSGVPATDGFSLGYIMQRQAADFGAVIMQEDIAQFDLSGDVKTVTLSGGGVLTAKAVILATGTRHRKLGLPNEDALTGGGVSYCATCDGNFFRGQTVIVNGGGDTAVTDALYLAGIAKEVYLVHRRQGFRAAQILVDRLKSSNVKLVLDSVITSLNGDPLKSVTVKNTVTNQETEIMATGLFVAVGTIPNSALFKEQVETDAGGYVITDAHMRTNLPGVYAAGDIRVTPLRQVITACADAAIAATTAAESL